MGKIVEGLWDCKYCDKKGIKGSIRECPGCGKPRDDSTKFYLPSKITYLSDEEASKINKNPDWICNFCGCLNSDNDDFCKSCGASRIDTLNYFENAAKKESVNSEDSYEDNVDSNYDFDNKIITHNKPVKNNSFKDFIFRNWKWFVFIPLGIVIIALLIFLLIPKEETVAITGFKWQYTINIEKLETFDRSDWSLPSDARLKYTTQEIHHYDNILDHYETKTRQVTRQVLDHYENYVSGYRDLGNGHFEEIIGQRPVYRTVYDTETYQEPVYRQVPVYQTKYYYEIDEYVFERSIKTGAKDKSPYWGKYTLNDLEKVGNKETSYHVIGINSKGKENEYSFSYDEWNSLEINDVIRFKKSIFGNKLITEKQE